MEMHKETYKEQFGIGDVTGAVGGAVGGGLDVLLSPFGGISGILSSVFSGVFSSLKTWWETVQYYVFFGLFVIFLGFFLYADLRMSMLLGGCSSMLTSTLGRIAENKEVLGSVKAIVSSVK